MFPKFEPPRMPTEEELQRAKHLATAIVTGQVADYAVKTASLQGLSRSELSAVLMEIAATL